MPGIDSVATEAGRQEQVSGVEGDGALGIRGRSGRAGSIGLRGVGLRGVGSTAACGATRSLG